MKTAKLKNNRTRAHLNMGLAITPGQSNVDRENGIIHDVSVISCGEALGHEAWIDEVFLDQVVKMGNSKPNGWKSRYTHPGLSADGLAKYLGRVNNFRRKGYQVIGVLHLSEKVTGSSPDGDLYNHVLNFAEEDPESFGVSIVYYRDIASEEAFAKVNQNDEGEFRSPNRHNWRNLRHHRLAELDAVDIVGDPASNEKGLFTRGNILAQEAETLAGFVLGVTEDSPELVCFDAEPEKVRSWLQGYLDRHGLKVLKKENIEMTEKKTEEKVANQAAAGEGDFKEVESHLKELGRQEEKTRFESLAGAFADRPEFVVEQYRKGATLEQAKAAFSEMRIAELEAELAKRPAKTEQSSGSEPVNYDDSAVEKPVSALDKARKAKALSESEGISVIEALRRLS